MPYVEFLAIEEPATLQKVDNVSAFPQQQQQTSNQSTFLQDLLALVCGALCKNTPLADIVPQPEERLFLTGSLAFTAR